MLNALHAKINLYMQKYIIPVFDPSCLQWVFSLSGGKDSYAMCQGIFDWYQTHQHPINAIGIYIWQWGENPEGHLRQTLPWLDRIYIKDVRKHTPSLFDSHAYATQAPCRQCADVRRNVSDAFLEEVDFDGPILLCRGLHLTDMAISLLWRLVWHGPNPCLRGKGRPLAPLSRRNSFLCKPLCLVREYECQEYAREQKYTPFSCDCPSALFPSRRDIIEESIRYYYTGSLWEFDVPGCTSYLRNTLKIADVSTLAKLSLQGTESKTNSIPTEYYTFAKKHFIETVPTFSVCKEATLLESHISSLLLQDQYCKPIQHAWTCRLYSHPDCLTDFDLRMIGTLGPFWAAVALPLAQRNLIFSEQSKMWSFTPDKEWNQVCRLLSKYYQTL